MGTINIKIDYDGIGFGDAVRPAWVIASRVAELGDHLAVKSEAMDAHLEIRLTIAQA